MQPTRYTIVAVLILVICQLSLPCYAQLGITLDIKKPKEYDERVLRSEKSDEKKFTLPRRFIQNTVTHYNYVFNANNKLNEILERAKSAFTDDYSKLLPFYNYTLDATAQDSIQLDSINYKSQTGIALHDLRNDWADNLYLLWGATYYLRKQFDSAYLMFQFINYAFAEKEKDGYYKTIGSSRDGTDVFSISTKEKNSLPRRIFSEPPSRNDAFIWQIRNFLAEDKFAEAASLIVTLKSDPAFPKRLQDDLHEVQAYWFYKNNMWDSAAVHLVNALGNATNKQEMARWEYLAAQLFEMTGNYKEAEHYYAKVINHTTDPIMDIYARLFSIRVNKDGGEKNIDRNIAELVKMAKRDKYVDYRDIIYYMAAQMELERNNVDGALGLLAKSTQSNTDNIAQRNKAFLQLAELSFKRGDYRQAYNFYDSLRMDDPMLKDPEALTKRKELLGNLAQNMEIVERQDSLQRIAGLSEDERKEFVKKIVRQLRKQQGLKDEGPLTTGSSMPTSNIPTLFPTDQPKGEWVLYDPVFRARGFNEFRKKWGNRPNTDNWRRSATITAGLQNMTPQNPGLNTINPPGGKTNATPGEITFESLYGNLPLTPEQLQQSNDSIQTALFVLGKLYIQEIEDCAAGTTTLEQLRERFPNYEKMDEVLFNLYYCYNKNGEVAKAAAIKKLMGEKYAASNFNTILATGKNPQSTNNPDATKAYEKIYDLFIEGNFEEAIAQKKVADNLYGKNYWTPQLLYIESVYYIKQREDSSAKNTLNAIVAQFPGTALAQKATIMLDVLSRRKQIEEELRNLQINRPQEDTTVSKPTIVNAPPPRTDTMKVNQPLITPKPVIKDTTLTTAPKTISSPYTFSADAAHYVLLILNKVDPVFSNEAKNAFFRYNRETFYNKIMTAELIELDADNRLLLISPFKNAQEAVDYVERTRPKTASEIIPWLKGGKYNFSIISEKNLDLLKANKDIENYKTFLNEKLPGKF